MADYDRNTNPLSTQYRTLLEIVDDVLARYELTRRDSHHILHSSHQHVREQISCIYSEALEPIAELERRLR